MINFKERHTMPRSFSYPLILASTSPRRQELLTSLGLEFTIAPPPVDEDAFDLAHLDAGGQVKFLSRLKAQEVFKRHPHAIVIGADTLVVSDDGVVLGKPKDTDDAIQMLSRLQGKPHGVYSGVTVFSPHADRNGSLNNGNGQSSLNHQKSYPPFLCDISYTQVWMRALSPAEITAYVATGEPLDKAGAYAIQGIGSTLISRIEGCYFNVVGLPLSLLSAQLSRLDEMILA